MTNLNSLLHSVLIDEDLMKLGGYETSETENLYDALNSDNYIVSTVAKIIYAHENGKSNNVIYREISNHLQNKV